MGIMTIEEARDAALRANPGWSSSDIENVARGMVAKATKLHLLDQLAEEVAEFDAAEAERREAYQRENPDSLLGMLGGSGWGSQSERDDAQWAQTEAVMERNAQRIEEQSGGKADDDWYERQVLRPWQKAQQEAMEPKADTGPRPATIEDANAAKRESAADIRARLLLMPFE
jgi:hypothetical protein